MSLLIKGMDMPKDCAVCPCCVDVGQGDETEYFCSADDCAPDIQDITAGRLQTCPLSETHTPHGRLIDADRLIVALRNSVYANAFFRDPTLTVSQIEQLIEHQPTIIEAEGKS